MINQKAFWNKAAVYAVGFLFIRAISFLLLPLYTKFLNPEILGSVFLLITLLAFLNTVFNHGMDAAMLKFFHDEEYKKVISTSIIYSVFVGLFFMGTIFLFRNILFQNFLTELSSVVFSMFLSFVLFFDMLSTRLLNVLRMIEKPYYFLFICLINVVASLALNIILIKNLNLGFDGAFLSIFGTSLIQFLCLSPILVYYVRISLVKKTILHKMLQFGLPVFPSAMFLVIIELSDRWMLKWFDSLESVGLYGAGYKIATLILMIVKAFNLNWQPYYLKNNSKENYKNYGFIGSLFILVLIGLCTALTLTYPYLIKLNIWNYSIIDPAFWEGATIIPIIAFAYLFFGVFILQMPSVYLKNKPNWLPLFWGTGFMINIIGNFFLIPKFSFWGAAISTLLSYVGMVIFIVYKNSSWLPIKYSLKPILILITASVVIMASILGNYFYHYVNVGLIIIYVVGSVLFIKNQFSLLR